MTSLFWWLNKMLVTKRLIFRNRGFQLQLASFKLSVVNTQTVSKAWEEKEKKENLAEIARLEQNLENLRVSLYGSKFLILHTTCCTTTHWIECRILKTSHLNFFRQPIRNVNKRAKTWRKNSLMSKPPISVLLMPSKLPLKVISNETQLLSVESERCRPCTFEH